MTENFVTRGNSKAGRNTIERRKVWNIYIYARIWV